MNYQYKHIQILTVLALMAFSTGTKAHGIPPVRVGYESAFVEVTTFLDEDNGYNGGGSGVSLREAVQYSAPGAVVILKSGAYALNEAGLSTLTLKRDIIIKGAGVGETRIAGAGGSVFQIRNGINATISDL